MHAPHPTPPPLRPAQTHLDRRFRAVCMVGCTAEVRQLRRQANGSVALVARGRQRVELQRETVVDTTRSARGCWG